MAPEIRGVAFVKYTEVKDPKRHHFFLVDAAGRRFHAGTAVDQGGAHYEYTSVPPFDQVYQPFTGTNKKEMIMWLEMVMKQSQAAAGQQAEIAHLGEPTPDNPFGTYFVSYKQTKEQLADGRNCHKWLLKDQHGQEHLAVVGEEMISRDGHYQYHAEEPFASRYPLAVSNQSGVLHWIESMLTHLAPPGAKLDMTLIRSEATRGPDQGTRGAAGGQAHPSFASPASPTGRGGGGRHRGGRGGKHKLSGAAQESVKRAKRPEEHAVASTPGTGGLVAGDGTRVNTAAQQATAALRRAAAADAAERESLRAATLCWVQGSASEEELEVVRQWHTTLKQLWQDANKDILQACQTRPLRQPSSISALMRQQQHQHQHQPVDEFSGDLGPELSAQTWTYPSDLHNHQHGLRLVLECLRELGSLCPPVQSMLELGLVDTVRLFCSHPHPTVASLAQQVMGRWQRRVLAALVIMTDSVFCEDPLLQVDTILQQREEISQAVTSELMHESGSGALPQQQLAPCRAAGEGGCASAGTELQPAWLGAPAMQVDMAAAADPLMSLHSGAGMDADISAVMGALPEVFQLPHQTCSPMDFQMHSVPHSTDHTSDPSPYMPMAFRQ